MPPSPPPPPSLLPFNGCGNGFIAVNFTIQFSMFCGSTSSSQVYHQNSPSSSHQIYGNVLNTSLTNLGYASSWHTSGDYGMFQNSYHYQTPEYLPIGDLRYFPRFMNGFVFRIEISLDLIKFCFCFCLFLFYRME